MLDVHPPHQSIHGWKDFLTHIATITIGLLIAIGLEQSVEYIHHLNQLHAARHELSEELDQNRRIHKLNSDEAHRMMRQLDRDMEVLRASRSSGVIPVRELSYAGGFRRPRDGAWQSVKQNGTLELMPQSELERYVYVYAVFDSFMEVLTASDAQLNLAAAIARRAPDGRLTPHEVEELITATSAAQGRMAYVSQLLEYTDRGLNHGR